MSERRRLSRRAPRGVQSNEEGVNEVKANETTDGTMGPLVDLSGRSEKSPDYLQLTAAAMRAKLPPVQKLVLIYLADGGRASAARVAEFAGITERRAAAVMEVLQVEGMLALPDGAA